MLFTQHRLKQPEYLSMHLFRLLILALISQHQRLVVHACQYGMDALYPAPSRSSQVLVDLSGLLIEDQLILLGSVILATCEM